MCSYFRDYRVADFAKSGMVADKTIIIDPNDNTLKFFPTTMFNLFRKYVTDSLRQGDEAARLVHHAPCHA